MGISAPKAWSLIAWKGGILTGIGATSGIGSMLFWLGLLISALSFYALKKFGGALE